MQKKILMLGGSAAQLNAIKRAKNMGLYVILCDYLLDNPGQHYADEYIPTSTTDKEKILEIAKNNNVDGVLSYISDSAAPTAAYVGNILGLPSNPYNSVLTLCRKDLFRQFLKNNGFNVPVTFSTNSLAEAELFFVNFNRKCAIKPVDSSGSKGVSILESVKDLHLAFNKAMSFSRCKKIIIEEFIEHKSPYMIGGDGFLVDGDIKFICFLNCHRDYSCNRLVPVGKSSPCVASNLENQAVRNEISKALSLLKMKLGAFNFEVIIDKNDRVFILEIGPRNGGNLIPEHIRHLTGIDMIDLTISSSMGMDCSSLEMVYPQDFIASHVVHSSEKGILKKLSFSSCIEERTIHKCVYKKQGDSVEKFNTANDAIGIIITRFKNEKEMHDTINNIYRDHIKIVLY